MVNEGIKMGDRRERGKRMMEGLFRKRNEGGDGVWELVSREFFFVYLRFVVSFTHSCNYLFV